MDGISPHSPFIFHGMSSQAQHIHRLASAFAAGPMNDREQMIARAKPMVGDLRKARWLPKLAGKLELEFGEAPRPTIHRIADRIRADEGFLNAWIKGNGQITAIPVTPQMAPSLGAPRLWKIPTITTLRELSTTLNLDLDDLGWLASRGTTQHYNHRWLPKPKSGRFRLIESPKGLLKFAQRQILRRILAEIPPHDAACGFRTGCSVRDFVKCHTAKDIVIRIDLEDFFPSISATRILHLFLTAGYPEKIARTLTQLTTHATPALDLTEHSLTWPERRRLRTPHLPQGAPSSPALANLAAFRLDCRLDGLANAVGADYTRYADDLLFSGGTDFARRVNGFVTTASSIIIEEGFHPNHRKTRVMRQSQKQHAAGLVLNDTPNIDRRDFDRLKAILTNCVRHGPESQNRQNHRDFAAHLSGRLAWIRYISPAKEAKLRALFDQIIWSPPRSTGLQL